MDNEITDSPRNTACGKIHDEASEVSHRYNYRGIYFMSMKQHEAEKENLDPVPFLSGILPFPSSTDHRSDPIPNQWL